MDKDVKKIQKITPLLLGWYRENARNLPWREDSEPYRIWVSEIMLQQTRVEAVIKYYERFLVELPDIAALAEVSDGRLHKLWEGLGYYSRARNMKKAAQLIMREYDGKFPEEYGEMLKLPGIGSYTAGAISSIAFGVPHPAVDGNVLRVLSRFLGRYGDITEQKTKAEIERMLKEAMPEDSAGDFTQALMEIGAVLCLPGGAPRCEGCPFNMECVAKRDNLQAVLPVKTPKKKREVRKMTALVIMRDTKLAICKREEKGLLQGVWGLPMLDGWQDETAAREYLGGAGCLVASIEKLRQAKHIFTHVEWHMKGYLVRANETGTFTWASKEEIESVYALPSAFRQYIAAYLDVINGNA